MPGTAGAWESPRDRVGRADPKPFCEFGACPMAQLADATLRADSALYLTHIQRDDRTRTAATNRSAHGARSCQYAHRRASHPPTLSTHHFRAERLAADALPLGMLEIAASQQTQGPRYRPRTEHHSDRAVQG